MQIVNGKREDLDKQVSDLIEENINLVLSKKDKVVFGVPGGSSIVGIFKNLQKTKVDWNKVHFFFVDERWVEPHNEDSNYRVLKENLLDGIEISDKNVHIFYPEKGVKDYQNQFEELGNKLDIALLGSGEDGHIASLFPNHDGLNNEDKGYFEVNDSPKSPTRRISLSKTSIKESDIAILLFYGEGKREAFENFKNPNVSILDCPAKIISEIQNSYIFTDLD